MNNYVISRKRLEELYESLGEEQFEKTLILEPRMSGRTTSSALFAIANSMRNPGKFINIEDHHNTLESHRCLLNTIQKMVKDLELKGFEFKVIPKPTVCFTLYEVDPKELLRSKK